jgi:hypothetical protein
LKILNMMSFEIKQFQNMNKILKIGNSWNHKQIITFMKYIENKTKKENWKEKWEYKMERKNKKKYKKDRKRDKMGWANGAYGACREPPAPQRAAYRISLHRSYPIRACCGQIDDSYTPIRSVRIARRTPARGCGPAQ